MPADSEDVYLTFDDGPTPDITPAVLSLLKDYNAKATFFCIGENVKKNPHIYEQIINEGHTTGNHTQHHYNAWKVKRDEYLDDVYEAAQLIASPLFRPPYGTLTPAIINRLKKEYKIILWDVITYDFDLNLSAEEIYKNSISRLRAGSIIVFHDSIKAAPNMLKVLPRFLRYCEESNYTLKAIPAK